MPRLSRSRKCLPALGVGSVPPDRAGWLARPWFFASVAVLALNDHVLKASNPGPVTGKLSDVAGLVVVGTVASVLVGRSWGTVLAGVAFAALKTLPGVAEAAAPVLGGGVTLQDATDLVALAGLPVLWVALGRVRTDHPAGKDRGRRAAGLLVAVLATTATTAPPPSEVRDVGFVDGDVYARVYLEEGTRTVWLRSLDRGATWRLTEDPGQMSEATYDGGGPATAASARDATWQQCADDGVCWRVRSHFTDTALGWQHLVERRDPGSKWVTEFQIPWSSSDLAVDHGDSTKVVVTDGTSAFLRVAEDRWKEVALIPLAASAG